MERWNTMTEGHGDAMTVGDPTIFDILVLSQHIGKMTIYKKWVQRAAMCCY